MHSPSNLIFTGEFNIEVIPGAPDSFQSQGFVQNQLIAGSNGKSLFWGILLGAGPSSTDKAIVTFDKASGRLKADSGINSKLKFLAYGAQDEV